MAADQAPPAQGTWCFGCRELGAFHGRDCGCACHAAAKADPPPPARVAAEGPTREQMIGFAQRSADDAWLNANTHTAQMFAAIAQALALSHCSACGLTHDAETCPRCLLLKVEQLADVWTDPEFWAHGHGSTLDSADCGRTLKAILGPKEHP